MRKNCVLLLMLLLCVLPTSAQNYGELSINDVRARFHAHGLIGLNLGASTAAFEVPQDGGVHSLYAGGLWVGGLSAGGQLHLAAMKYEAGGEADYYTGPLMEDGSAGTNATMMSAYDNVWEVTSEQVAQHLAYYDCLSEPGCDLNATFPNGYVIPANFFDWPAINSDPGFAVYQAPFIDYNNDGDYDPSDGDAPCILGDQALYFVFNDKGGLHMLTNGQPIGLEVQAMPFAYNSGGPYLDQTIFVHYHIINRSALTLEGTRIGVFNDFDLGCGEDDLVGTDAARNLTYVYNGDEQDDGCLGANGYGTQPPAFGMVVLKGPYRDENLADEEDPDMLPSWNGTGFGDGIIDNEKHGLGVSMHMYRQGDDCCTDPSTPSHYLNYLRGVWKDGVPLAYGGNGHPSSPAALDCLFSFPGDSDPVGAGIFGNNPQAPWYDALNAITPDRRMLSSMGPFTLEPGMHEDLLLAYVFARAGTGGAIASVQALQARVDSVIDFAQTLPLWTNLREEFQVGCEGLVPEGMHELLTSALRVFPVPASDAVQMDVPEALVGGTLVIRDITGRMVAQHRLLPGRNTMNTDGLATGIYTCEAIAFKVRAIARIVKE